MKKTHGQSNNDIYNIWKAIKRRVTSKRSKDASNYSLRNIDMDKSWFESFESFLNDMGQRPSKKHSIDRIDNNKGYYKDNCRWATSKEQNRNKRNTMKLILNLQTGVFYDTIVEAFESQEAYSHRMICYYVNNKVKNKSNFIAI